eukprot:CAMPEP_0202966564 /NCGR_PEP_ID=MMETSP1396-20130829/11029_1 /ASSEMBLY_ACC=CAM_ASM_000872 /TAXON_ID= /ORGANISM="Pseudokeronopsis sp., Strain Brazil" /LENGTH=89 /DNA_ID=CAMNT_0049690571 /DNA_START=274 /DNA_END=539 /DNA_ORIENTATION=+
MREIASHYCEKDSKGGQVARFLSIYVEEAHAIDEWWLWDAPEAHVGGKRCILNHISIEDRVKVANKMQKDIDFPGEIICDAMIGEVNDR